MSAHAGAWLRGWLLLSLALLSGVSLAWELVLIRLLGFVHFAAFAAMIISLALLGYAASGALLAVRQRPLGAMATGWTMAIGAAAIPAASWVAVRIPFNELALTWDPQQSLWLLCLFLLLSVPFFLVSLVIGSLLIARPAMLGQLYGADLLGAGAGAAGAILLLNNVPLEQVAGLLGVLGGVGVSAYVLALRAWRLTAVVLLPLLVGVTGMAGDELRLSPYKPLAQAMAAGGQVLAQSSTALGVLTTVHNPRIPIRFAPGISFLAPDHPAGQLGLFLDGGQMTAADPTTASPDYLLAIPSALGYDLAPVADVLLLNPGAGLGVRQAVAAGAGDVTAIAVDPRLADRLQSLGAEVAIAQPRHWLAASARDWDLVVWDGALAPARYAALGSENYLLTVEALRDQLAHLRPGGAVVLHVPLEVPPRGAMRLLTTIAAALEDAEALRERLAIVRSWSTVSFVLAGDPLTGDQQSAVREFADRYGFDLAWLPGLSPDEANRRLRWDRPWLFDAVRALLAEDERFFADYPFETDPLTDDRPWYDDHFRWSLLPLLIAQQEQGGLALLDTGFLLLTLTVLLALVLGLPLVVLPWWRQPPRSRMPLAAVAYFAAIGLGFLAIEIAFIQQLHLLFGHPLHAIALGLAGFLLFAGAGGLLAGGSRRVAPFALGVVACCLVYAFAAGELARAGVGWAGGGRLVLGVALTAPLGFLLGVPFPVGLRRLAERDAAGAGLAWGINGWASVLSAPLATLLAMAAGFRLVLLAAAVCYATAWLAARSRAW